MVRRIRVELLEQLNALVETLNGRAGAKIRIRNKLIVKAIEDYCFKEMVIPAQRRKSSIPVNQNRHKQDDRRRKENVTCASRKMRFIHESDTLPGGINISEDIHPESDRIGDMESEELIRPGCCSLCGEYVRDGGTLIVGKFGSICSECIVLCVLILGEAQQEEYAKGVADLPEMS